MKENSITSWDIDGKYLLLYATHALSCLTAHIPDISELIDGKEVSKYSVKHCLRDLNLW